MSSIENEYSEVNTNIFDDADESAPNQIKEPFDPTQIDIAVQPMIIDTLVKRIKTNRITLNPEFQRMPNLWKEKEQSRLIESLLVRIPLPAFYFDGIDDNNWKVVDGLQRLSVLNNFIINKTLKLSDLEFLKNYENNGWDDLPTYLQGRIEEAPITAYIIKPGTPSDVQYIIFKRINTGGLVLKPQEIRHALNQGIPANFIAELTELEEFKKATDYAFKNSRRMEDRDIITRFIAFYDGYGDYKPDLDSYLNNKMGNLAKINSKGREKIKNDFIKSMNATYNIFENDAFRKRYDVKDKRNQINKALFEAWAVNIAKLSPLNIQVLISKKDKVKNKFIAKLNNDKKFNKSITSATGDKKAVKERFDKIKELIREILND